MSSGKAQWGHLGKFGIWAVQFRFGDPGFIAECAAETEELGYGALWFPGGRGGELNTVFLNILNATRAHGRRIGDSSISGCMSRRKLAHAGMPGPSDQRSRAHCSVWASVMRR